MIIQSVDFSYEEILIDDFIGATQKGTSATLSLHKSQVPVRPELISVSVA